MREKKIITKENKKLLPVVLPHNPLNPHVKQQILNILSILNFDQRVKKMYSDIKVIWSHTQPQNLQQILCPSFLKNSDAQSSNVQTMITKCHKPRCLICDITEKCSSVTFENGNEFFIKHEMNCDVNFVIYQINCRVCNACYLGETTNFRLRVNKHKSDVKTAANRKLPVNKHLFHCAKGNFSITPIFKCYGESLVERRLKETSLIKKFKPTLNKETDCIV